MTDAKIIGAVEVEQKLLGIKSQVADRVGKQVRALGIQLLNKVKEDKLNGQVLKIRTGNLRGLVNERPENDGNVFTSIVGVKCEYAAIHEFGGVIKISGSRPRAINMPMRSYLRSSLEDLREHVTKKLLETVRASCH